MGIVLDPVVLAKNEERRRLQDGEAAQGSIMLKSGMIFDETNSYLNKSSSGVFLVEVTAMWEVKISEVIQLEAKVAGVELEVLSIKKAKKLRSRWSYVSVFVFPGSIVDKVLGSFVWDTTFLLCCQISKSYRKKACKYSSSKLLAEFQCLFVVVRKVVLMGCSNLDFFHILIQKFLRLFFV